MLVVESRPIAEVARDLDRPGSSLFEDALGKAGAVHELSRLSRGHGRPPGVADHSPRRTATTSRQTAPRWCSTSGARRSLRLSTRCPTCRSPRGRRSGGAAVPA
ncbi:hypothetical protein ACFXOD_35720 [Streptomyces sp. NPDC059161]|uniref:hypothetical protein n=1 Tax=Streptomyces sp. NPDC059161 TaxID=3346749 RepID=UPI00369F1BD5